jgi:hypothetical protein
MIKNSAHKAKWEACCGTVASGRGNARCLKPFSDPIVFPFIVQETNESQKIRREKYERTGKKNINPLPSILASYPRYSVAIIKIHIYTEKLHHQRRPIVNFK